MEQPCNLFQAWFAQADKVTFTRVCIPERHNSSSSSSVIIFATEGFHVVPLNDICNVVGYVGLTAQLHIHSWVVYGCKFVDDHALRRDEAVGR
jgi:hypothetical protein